MNRFTTARRGFSLLELLVVVAIIALLTSVAVLAVGNADVSRQSRVEAERFVALIEVACERAVLSGRSSGVVMSNNAYRFVQQDRQRWLGFAGADLRARQLPNGMIWLLPKRQPESEIPSNRRTTPLVTKPDVQCLPSGELSPFDLALGLEGEQNSQWRIRGEIDGSMRIDAPDQNRETKP